VPGARGKASYAETALSLGERVACDGAFISRRRPGEGFLRNGHCQGFGHGEQVAGARSCPWCLEPAIDKSQSTHNGECVPALFVGASGPAGNRQSSDAKGPFFRT